MFTFGKSKFGDSAPNKFWIRDDKVIRVCCGDEHTGIISGDSVANILLLVLVCQWVWFDFMATRTAKNMV